MAEHPPRDALSAKQYVTLMLRILIDRTGTVQSGELVDLEGQTQGRFTGWDGLIARLQEWLRRSADSKRDAET